MPIDLASFSFRGMLGDSDAEVNRETVFIGDEFV